MMHQNNNCNNVRLADIDGEPNPDAPVYKDRNCRTNHMAHNISEPSHPQTPMLIRANYDVQTGLLHTNQIVTKNGTNNHEHIGQCDPRHWSTTILSRIIAGPIESVFFNKHSNRRLILYLFYLSVFLSVLNTLLLSFLVKLLHLNQHSSLFEDNLIAWDEHSESLALDLPVNLRGDKHFSVDAIESYQDKPLIIENVVQTATNSSVILDHNQAALQGQILIRAKSSSSSSLPDSGRSNHILVSADLWRDPPSSNGQQRATNRRLQPVEIVANSLILNQLIDLDRASPTPSDMHQYKNPKSHHQTVGLRSDRHEQSKRHSTKSIQSATTQVRSVLELDGERHMIVVPSKNKLDLFPPSAKTLFVKGELKCQPGISGKLNDNFDLQARWGNLSFQSGRTLRIVSRSDKLNLASTRQLSLEAPILRFSVPKTNKVLISDGIEYLKAEDKRHQLDESDENTEEEKTIASRGSGNLNILNGNSEQQQQQFLDSASLEAFKLVIIDDILMASKD